MRLIFQLTLLIIIGISISWSLIPDIKKKYSSYFRTGNEGPYAYQPKFHALRDEGKNKVDVLTAKDKRVYKQNLPNTHQFFGRNNDQKQHYVIDKVLNVLRRFDDTDKSQSSSREERNWKDEWKELWVKKKIEALNVSTPRGDVVNMNAARPWGKSCGDPHQHDVPWGSCTLISECDAEYRIYRGDYFCGRTQFVCCALQLTAYDMYNGIDISFANSEFKTDSDELRYRDKGSKERKRRKKLRERKRRQRNRSKRKRKIKRNIKKIVKEISKVLDRSYKNSTKQKKKKTKELKKYIKFLKKQYKKTRVGVRDVNELEMIKVDAALHDRLNQIKDVNQQFVRNQTFRDLIVNGTISKKIARKLVEKYPDLADAIDIARRDGGKKDKLGIKPDYLDYDIEYGMVYF